MYKVGKETAFKITMKILLLNKIIPARPNDKAFLKRFNRQSITLRLLSFAFFCVGSSLHLMKITKEHIEEIDVSEDMTVIVGGVVVLLICYFFTYKCKHWHQFLVTLLDFRQYGQPEEVEMIIRESNNFAKFFGLYYFVGTLGYAAAAIMDAPLCNKINNEKNYHLICDTFVSIWLPFDIPYRPYRWLIFVAQFILVNTSVSSAAMVCFLVWESSRILGAHFHHLESYFEKLMREGNMTRRSMGIGYWIRYHNYILRMSSTLHDLAKFTTGHITIASAVVIGCAENQLLKNKPLGALIFLLGFMAGVFIFCAAGQNVMDNSLATCDALFCSQWYRADLETMKDLVLILMRTQKPAYLAALPLGTVNYALFVMIIRTSYSYLTLLNNS